MAAQGPSPTQCVLSALLWDQPRGHRQKDEPWVPNLEGKNDVLWRFWRSFTTSESFSDRPSNPFPWFWVLYVNKHQMPLKHNEEARVRKQQESGWETDPAFACLDLNIILWLGASALILPFDLNRKTWLSVMCQNGDLPQLGNISSQINPYALSLTFLACLFFRFKCYNCDIGLNVHQLYTISSNTCLVLFESSKLKEKQRFAKWKEYNSSGLQLLLRVKA